MWFHIYPHLTAILLLLLVNKQKSRKKYRIALLSLANNDESPFPYNDTEICQPGWGYFNGYCYVTSNVCASWLTAASVCSSMSSNLVTIHNQEENVYVQRRHNGEKSWIGLNDRSVEGSFEWTNREISDFRFWAPKQPDNLKNEDCVHTLGAKQGYVWDDAPCDRCFNFTCFKGKTTFLVDNLPNTPCNLFIMTLTQSRLRIWLKNSAME